MSRLLKPTLEISEGPELPTSTAVTAVTAVPAPPVAATISLPTATAKTNEPAHGLRTEKPKEDRVKEIVSVMKELRNLGIPLDCPEVKELREHLNAYINEGVVWQGTVSFLRFGRIAEVTLPRRADKLIEIKLRVPRAGR